METVKIMNVRCEFVTALKHLQKIKCFPQNHRNLEQKMFSFHFFWIKLLFFCQKFSQSKALDHKWSPFKQQLNSLIIKVISWPPQMKLSGTTRFKAMHANIWIGNLPCLLRHYIRWNMNFLVCMCVPNIAKTCQASHSNFQNLPRLEFIACCAARHWSQNNFYGTIAYQIIWQWLIIIMIPDWAQIWRHLCAIFLAQKHFNLYEN